MKCLHCDHDVLSRGLCSAHYYAIDRDRRAARRSWEELEQKGQSLPSKHKCRRRVPTPMQQMTSGVREVEIAMERLKFALLAIPESYRPVVAKELAEQLSTGVFT